MIVLVVECVYRLGEKYGCRCVCVGAQGGGLEGYMFSVVIICIIDSFLTLKKERKKSMFINIIISLNDFDVALMFFLCFFFFFFNKP